VFRNVNDVLGKNVLRDVFQSGGSAETEAEVPPGNARRIDVWFVPDEAKRAQRSPLVGILAEIAAEAAVIEMWSDSPSNTEFHGSMTKRDLWREILELRDKRSWSPPMLWHICAGKPSRILREYGFDAFDFWGWYRPRDPGWRVNIIVIDELPLMQSTLLLRLLGRGKVRREALHELRCLPEYAWENLVALPWLLRLGFDVPIERWAQPEEREFVMDIQVWYKNFLETRDREAEARALRTFEAQRAEERRQLDAERQALEAQRAEVRRALEAQRVETQRLAELNQLVHQFEHRFGRKLTSNEHATLVSQVKAHSSAFVADLVLDLSASELETWLAT
jgi:hypothetical protein